MNRATDSDDIGLWSRLRWPLTLTVLLITLLYTIFVYNELPEVMPIHFDEAGRPNDWAPKSVGAFMGPAMQAFMIVLYYFIHRISRDPEKAVSSRWSGFSTLTPEQFRQLRPAMLALVDVLMMALIFMFAGLQYVTNEVALGNRDALGPLPWIFLVFIMGWSLLIAVYLPVKAYRLKKTGPQS